MCLNIRFADCPADARAHTSASSATSSFCDTSQAYEARDLDWVDYTSELDKDEGGGSHAENPLAAQLAVIPPEKLVEVSYIVVHWLRLVQCMNRGGGGELHRGKIHEYDIIVADLLSYIACYITSIHAM